MFSNYNILFLLLVIIDMTCCHKPDSGNKINQEELFQQDLGDSFKIDASTEGLQKVHLKCGSNSMYVQLETDDYFNGVMYTKGSYYKQKEPCFARPSGSRSRSLKMRFPFNDCQTVQDGEIYKNVIIVQHDPDLVTPGDSAFELECDFRKPRNLNVNANMQARDRLATFSRISLTSPDPTVIDTDQQQYNENMETFTNNSHFVTFTPIKSNSRNRNGNSSVHGTVETIQLDRKHSNDEL